MLEFYCGKCMNPVCDAGSRFQLFLQNIGSGVLQTNSFLIYQK